jgi:hypothetical protein
MFSTPWLSRAAALLLLLAVLGGGWIWVVEPIAAAYRQTEAGLADGRDMLQRFERLGAALERHDLFPARTNVGFAQVDAPDAVKILIWERGVGPTQSSGTGSCASLVAAVAWYRWLDRRPLQSRPARAKAEQHHATGSPVRLNIVVESEGVER